MLQQVLSKFGNVLLVSLESYPNLSHSELPQAHLNLAFQRSNGINRSIQVLVIFCQAGPVYGISQSVKVGNPGRRVHSSDMDPLPAPLRFLADYPGGPGEFEVSSPAQEDSCYL